MKKFPTLLLYCSFLFLSNIALTQSNIQRIEPPNWWAGMAHPELQLLVYGKAIGHLEPSINYPGVSIQHCIRVENDNYLFINLILATDVKPGSFDIQFSDKGKTILTQKYTLLPREAGSAQREGFNQKDVLYLITPDRFANGNTGNDNVSTLTETINRSFEGGRHGGDVAGIEQHLDYIRDMGYTAIWLNPILENNMQTYSYHGYSTTDYYKVDTRYGSNEAYAALSKKAKSMGIKMIMDMIVNHCGLEHWWMKDLPCADWINNQNGPYMESNHRKTTLQDPHVAQVDKHGFTDGWFVPSMPDLNQRNPMMANYLTQNSIWWIEYAGLDGIRMDTYPYPDMDYMTEWTYRVMKEYPDFNVVGEEWFETQPAIVAYWQKGKVNPNGYTSYLRSLMDFPLRYALTNALNDKGTGWGDGYVKVYETLAMDFLYADPDELVVFPDNHDMDRFFRQVNQNFDLFKQGIIFYLTTRGVPQIYYGTEILMHNDKQGDHGIIRSDFPGGWPGDKVNGFTGEGLTEQQKEAQLFMKKLMNWRKAAKVIHEGKLMHYIPKDNVYIYFRYSESGKVMVVLNKNSTEQSLSLDRFAEMLQGVKVATNVLDGRKIPMEKTLVVKAMEGMVLELE